MIQNRAYTKKLIEGVIRFYNTECNLTETQTDTETN